MKVSVFQRRPAESEAWKPAPRFAKISQLRDVRKIYYRSLQAWRTDAIRDGAVRMLVAVEDCERQLRKPWRKAEQSRIVTWKPTTEHYSWWEYKLVRED